MNAPAKSGNCQLTMPLIDTDSFLQRIVKRTIISSNGCWLWCGTLSKSGHARVSIGKRHEKKSVYLHRYIWTLFIGKIPDGKCILHRCIGSANCWNPTHLYLGTPLDNARDREAQDRGGNHVGINNGRAVLTETDVVKIRKLRPETTLVNLAKKFRISPTHVATICNGKSWTHI
jgi:HNH endonuclease